MVSMMMLLAVTMLSIVQMMSDLEYIMVVKYHLQ